MNVSNFARAVELLGQAIGRSSIPIFECIYLRSIGDNLLMVARGSTTTIVRKVAVGSDMGLNVAVPRDMLHRVLGALPDGELKIWPAGTVLHLRCEGTDAKIAGMADDSKLMELAIPKTSWWIEFDKASAFTAALSRVRHAVAEAKLGRGAYGGVGLKLEDGRLESTAFDGVQFASVVIDGPSDEESPLAFNVAVAGDAVLPLIKIGNEMQSCRVHVGTDKLAMQSDPHDGDWWYIEAALLDGTHAGRGPLAKVASMRTQTMVLSKSDLTQALGLVAALRSERVLIEAAEGAVILSTPELEVGSTSQIIEARELPTVVETVALDPDFLRAAINGVVGKWVKLSTARNGPVHICGEDDGFDALVMIKTLAGPVERERALA